MAEMFLEETSGIGTTKSDLKSSKSVNQANLLCLIGDIKREEIYYERAWNESD